MVLNVVKIWPEFSNETHNYSISMLFNSTRMYVSVVTGTRVSLGLQKCSNGRHNNPSAYMV